MMMLWLAKAANGWSRERSAISLVALHFKHELGMRRLGSTDGDIHQRCFDERVKPTTSITVAQKPMMKQRDIESALSSHLDFAWSILIS